MGSIIESLCEMPVFKSDVVLKYHQTQAEQMGWYAYHLLGKERNDMLCVYVPSKITSSSKLSSNAEAKFVREAFLNYTNLIINFHRRGISMVMWKTQQGILYTEFDETIKDLEALNKYLIKSFNKLLISIERSKLLAQKLTKNVPSG